MTSALVETDDMMVVTCRVPCTSLDRLSLSVTDHTVSVEGPGGFRHRLELPPESDMERLGVQIFKEILELRAPRALPPVI